MKNLFKKSICLLMACALLVGALVLPSVAEGDEVTPDEVTPDEVTPDEVTPDEVTSDEVTSDEVATDESTDDLAPYSFRIEAEGTTRIEAEAVDLTHYRRSGDNPSDIVERDDASDGKFLAAATGAVTEGQYFTFSLVLDIDAELVMKASYAQTEGKKGNDQVISKTYTYIVDENMLIGLSNEYVLAAREDITQWETVTYDPITLPKGTHTFLVKVAENTGKGNPNIDYIEFDVTEIVNEEDTPKDETPKDELPEEKDERPFDMHTDLQYGYLNDPNINSIFQYAKGVLELSRPKAIVCDFSKDEGIGEAESYIIQKSATEDFSDPITIEGLTEKKYGFYNLLLGEHFYWRGGTDLETISSSPVHEVTVDSQGPRNCYVDGMTNVRDIGGYASSLVPGGYIKQGLYYRGAKPDNITEDGKKTMTEVLGVLAEIDLRDAYQCKGPYIDGVSYTAVSIPSGTESTRFEAFAAEYQTIYAVIADADEKPVYLHCTAGADRTGIVTFMLLAVCGVDIDDIARDYLFTNFSTQGARYKENEFDKWVAKLGNLEGDTLAEQAKTWMMSKGIPEAEIEEIREIFVEGYVAKEISQPNETDTAGQTTGGQTTGGQTNEGQTTEEPKKSGCGSVVGFGSVAILAGIAVFVAVGKKKDPDEE